MALNLKRFAPALLASASLALLLGCGGEAKAYAGTWKRDLYSEGEVRMNLASNGNIELMMPSPRWPDSVDMKGRAAFLGDTLVFKADTASSKCQTSDARYLINKSDTGLQIRGIGMDTCGGRRAALVGSWEKA
jgi:hypothetical protein